MGWALRHGLAALALALVSAAAAQESGKGDAAKGVTPAAGVGAPAAVVFDTPSPPFELGLFPCTSCHNEPGNPQKRELGFHDEMQPVQHGTSWCLDCHDSKNRDMLHLTNGDLIPFGDSYRLCGQCHGDKLRDWKVGVHGKRIGAWDGKKTYFLCVQCHNPHAPRFKGVETKEINDLVMQRPTAAPTRKANGRASHGDTPSASVASV